MVTLPTDPATRIARWSLAAGIGAIALLAVGVGLSSQPLWLFGPAVAGALLTYGRRSGRGWPLTLWLITQLVVIAGLRRPPALLLPAALLSLASWDLDHFSARLAHAPRVFEIGKLTRRHLSYLISALLLGGSSALIAVSGRVELAFAPAVLLVIGLLVGLNWLLRRGGAGTAA